MSKSIIITGAAGGIGIGLTKYFAETGWKVGMVDIKPNLSDIASSIDGYVTPAICDVRSSDEVNEAIETLEGEIGPIDALINNAGLVANIKSLAKMSDARWNNEIAVNLSSAFYFIRNLAPKMADRGWGRIVNVSSGAARSGLPAQVGYASTKSAFWGLTSTTAAEFGHAGVTCNSILPGVIATPMVLSMPEHIIKNAKGANSVKRIGEVEEIAYLVEFLCSEQAGYITGAEIDIDGGLRLNNNAMT